MYSYVNLSEPNSLVKEGSHLFRFDLQMRMGTSTAPNSILPSLHLLSPRGEDKGEGDVTGTHPNPNPLPPGRGECSGLRVHF
jgi:hypothetical protein